MTGRSYHPQPHHPVGILDSGLGGLSVFGEVSEQLPHENLLYFADTVHCPYGDRSLGEVRRLTEGIVRFLLSEQAKILVIASNTLSAGALHPLRDRFPGVPFVGMEPALKPAVEGTKTGVVGIVATSATFQGVLFASLVDRFNSRATVLTQPCPGLVEKVEAGQWSDPDTESLVRSYVAPLLAQNMDTLVLGCTHYPFLRRAFEKAAGKDVQIIDPAPAVARQAGRILAERGLLSGSPGPGEATFFTSGDGETFDGLQQRLTQHSGAVRGVRWSGETILPL
ncbi:MAG: glutamate racemase [Anaerolineae bacterium]